MPNMTWYISEEQMPKAAACDALTAECTDLCTEVLKAALDKVHIIFVTARHGRGHPAYIEIKYRLETFRPPEVMTQFMTALDASMVRHTGLKARIRCFGYAASDIHARN
jgi:hypothetical protein